MMKTMRKIMEGATAACISAEMYYCFLSGAPVRGTERILYMILAGIFCIFAWDRNGDIMVCEMASQTEQRTGKYDKGFA